jgi:hypothetical protein
MGKGPCFLAVVFFISNTCSVGLKSQAAQREKSIRKRWGPMLNILVVVAAGGGGVTAKEDDSKKG